MKIAEQLRKAVLQAAIQGKLTEQLPEDGNADDVFVKQFRKKTIKIAVDSYPFEVPNNWVWTNLGSIGEIVGGGTPKTTIGEYWGNDVPWITPADMKQLGGKYISRGKRNISNLGLKNSSAKIMPKGTVIFSSRAPIGYCAIANNDLSTNQGFKSIVPYISNMSLYIYYFMVAFKDEISKMGTGTTFKEISGSTVKKIPFALPPLLEQKRIVEKLDQILPMIDALEKDENMLDEVVSLFPDKMKASILQAAIQGKLTEQLPEDGDSKHLLNLISLNIEKQLISKKIKKIAYNKNWSEDEIPFDIPSNWAWVRIGSILTYLGSGGTPSRTESKYWNNGNIPWLKISDIKSKYINSAEEYITKEGLEKSSAHIFPKGTLLYTIYATIGDCGILNFESTTNQAIAGLKFIDEYIFTEYMYYVMLASKDRMVKSSRGMAQNNINQKILSNLMIPLPPLPEQKRIVNKIDKLLIEVESLKSIR